MKNPALPIARQAGQGIGHQADNQNITRRSLHQVPPRTQHTSHRRRLLHLPRSHPVIDVYLADSLAMAVTP
jgi:hypothetical protein